jgi:hypothetical protein
MINMPIPAMLEHQAAASAHKSVAIKEYRNACTFYNVQNTRKITQQRQSCVLRMLYGIKPFVCPGRPQQDCFGCGEAPASDETGFGAFEQHPIPRWSY